jgi:pimeloyl-ACP methyl ester carboxylesterase
MRAVVKINAVIALLSAQVQAILIAALIHLLSGFTPTGDAFAASGPTANDLQIETTLIQLLGGEQAARFRTILDPEEELSWQVYLPDNDSTEPPGVFVYVSPMKTGRIDSRWREVMDQQNLIYISANDSGNRILTVRRMVMANMAVKALAQHHIFDPAHIMVSGFSGGGRVASRLASQYPQVFTGALYICGVDFWKKDQTPDVERLLQNRFVFLTGSRDFNLRETKQIHKRYVKAGALHTKLIVVPGLAHQHPDAAYLTEALQFLLERDQ